MNFDEKMKARASREGCPIPEGFANRVDALLDSLPAQAAPVKKRRPARIAVCAAVAAALVVGASAAAPAVLSMAQGAVGFFSGAGEGALYTAPPEVFERYNAAVGASQTVDGLTLSIDNLAVDDNYIHVFYTLSSETPIEKPGEGSEPESWRARWAAPLFWARVDGRELDVTGAIEQDAYFVDDCTLKCMQRLPIKKALPDQFDLLLYAGDTSDKTSAKFRFPLSVDKSTVESLTVTPALDFTVEYSGVDELGDTYHVRRTPRVERVSVSPLSASLTLSEVAASPWDNFVLRDDKGKFLPLRSGTSVGSSDLLHNRVSNQFEFFGASRDTKAVTIIPIVFSDYNHVVKGALDALPLTDAVQNGLTLEQLEVGAEKAVATFSIRGAIWQAQAQFELTDKNGDVLQLSNEGYIESTVDRETGLIVATLYYPGASAEEVAQIGGVSFWQPDDITLLEEQAVTVPLR